MAKVAVVYWSGTGNTQKMAEAVVEGAKGAGAEVECFEVDSFSVDQIDGFDGLALGCPSMGAEVLEEEEFEPMFASVEGALHGKKIALFGCGDSSSYSDTFCSALGTIYNDLKDSGATFVGSVDPSDYTFDGSDAVVDGQFVGLPIDEVNESDKTDERISNWVASL